MKNLRLKLLGFLALLLGAHCALSQQQVINVGTGPNLNNGDPFRTWALKDNENGAQLFGMFGSNSHFKNYGILLPLDIANLFGCGGSSSLYLNGAGGCTAGGGGGTPGGSSGQIQYNNSGSFGGFTLSGDCTLNPTTGVITCTKTSGTAFGTLATATTSSPVISLWSGSCSSSTVLGGNGVCQAGLTLSVLTPVTTIASTDLFLDAPVSGPAGSVTPAQLSLFKSTNSIASASTITPSCAAEDNFGSNTVGAGTLNVNAPTGCTAAEWEPLVIHLKYTNTQTYSWNAAFENGAITLPTATSGSAVGDWVGFRYDSINSKWAAMAANGGSGGGSGTVTSVAATVPAFLSISGSPITTSGTLAIGLSGTALPAANGGTACAGLTGTASSTTFLRGDCSWNTPSASATSITPGTTTVVGATAPCLISNTSSTVMGCLPLGPTLAIASGTLGTTIPNRTVTTSPTVAAGDMGGVILSNVTGGGTVTIPAISSTVFASGMGLTIVNYSASTAAISTTPTVNAGGGCVSGTGIPAGDTWELTSNGTTLDCNQTISAASGGSGTVASSTSGQVAVYTGATTVTGGANATLTAGALTLGVSGTAGSVKLGNATSGTVTIQPVTGALGAAVFSVPAGTLTAATLTGTETLTNKTLTSPTMTAPVLGTPASGTLTNETNLPISTGVSGLGTGVATFLGTPTPANLNTALGVTVTQTIASGSTAMGTAAIGSGACATVVTATATGTATTDTINASFNGDPTAVTGYIPSSSGMLTIITYPTANTFNAKVCNNTAGSITPAALTINWHVLR